MYICRGAQAAMRYESQTAYTHGAQMCTTASMCWVLACVRSLLAPAPPSASMQAFMRQASDTHARASAALGSHAMLQQGEVIEQLGLPSGVSACEFYGYTSRRDPALAAFVCIDEIWPMLHEQARARRGGACFTGGGHSTALYLDASGVVYMFDPMPASVLAVASSTHLESLLREAHPHADQFTFTMVASVA